MKGCKPMKKEVLNTAFGSCPVNMSDEDILDAMKSIPGYLDITPGDFKEIFGYAYRHAVERIAQSLLAKDVMTAKVISVTPTTSLNSFGNGDSWYIRNSCHRQPKIGSWGYFRE
jgi:CBS-domain-containing membrane protein